MNHAAGAAASTVRMSDREIAAEAAFDAWFERYPDWTPAELAGHPAEARRLCAEVRCRLGRRRGELPDRDILGSLLRAEGCDGGGPDRRECPRRRSP